MAGWDSPWTAAGRAGTPQECDECLSGRAVVASGAGPRGGPRGLYWQEHGARLPELLGPQHPSTLSKLQT